MNKISAAVAALIFCAASVVHADSALPFLSPVFGDNMVLQRDARDRIWGWTTPGTAVVVTLAGKAFTGKADKTGRWTVTTSPLPAGGPYTVTIAGPESRTLSNVMLGDVWLCSGQSNMEMGIAKVNNAAAEIAAANYPNIRLYRVARTISPTPQQTLLPNADPNMNAWQTCTADNIDKSGWGGFSAVAYFFGRRLHKDLGVPIGLIANPWGGMPAEAFVSGDALKRLPDFKSAVEALQTASQHDDAERAFKSAFDGWYAKNDPGSAAPNWAVPSLDETKWAPIKLGTAWESAGIPELASFDGVAWYRVAFDAPAEWAGKDVSLSLGPIDDNDTTFFNGVEIGSTVGWTRPRAYAIPGSLVVAGRNVVAVRVLDTGGGGGIYGPVDGIFAALKDDATKKVSLGDKPWLYRIGAPLSSVATPPLTIDPNSPSTPTVIYNGMVAPLTPLAVKGAIWYQGESNAGRGFQYRTLMPALIDDWRDRFKSGEFPFFLVQLANYDKAHSSLLDTAWPEVREAQLMTVQSVPKTGMAVAIDIGDERDIHPKDKQDVGDRLALNALAIAYGRKLEYSGPIYKGMKVEGASIRVSFTHAAGLNAKGGKLVGFAIAASDHVFVPADAVIDGETVVVSAATVSTPVSVRYAFEECPDANLYNAANLPASPFRTDTWRPAAGVAAGN
jgi:sialate O-acetylesterase